MFHYNALSRSATFNLQKAGIAVGHVIRATNGIVVRRADFLATSE